MLSDAVGKAVEANERVGDGGIGGRRGLAIGSMVWKGLGVVGSRLRRESG
jgi:hypothetical protein